MKYIVIIVGYIFCLLCGNFFVKAVFKLIKFPEEKEESGIKYAGLVIGFLERFIILTFVLLN